MSEPLPLRAHLEWLKKYSKERLALLRVTKPDASLSEAKFEVAREYGFPSWQKLKAHVEKIREELDALVPPDIRQKAATEIVAPDDSDLATLFAAIEAGEPQVVSNLLSNRPSLAGAYGVDGQTPLHMAAHYNDPQIAALLIAYGADFNAKFGNSSHTPLSWAMTVNALECARELVRFGAQLDLFCAAGIGIVDRLPSFFDVTGIPIPGASRTGSSRFASDGTRLPCPPTRPQELVSDALYIACRNAQFEAVKFLLDKRPNLSFRAYLGATPLHWAYFGGSRTVVELLKQSGADVSARDDTLGCMPGSFGICVACNWGMAFLVRARLAEDPSLVNVMDGRTSPLHEAARNNRADIVKLLLERGANPLLKNGNLNTPLELAIEHNCVAAADAIRNAHQV